MTEAEWLACGEPLRLASFAQGRWSLRRQLLLACAGCHAVAMHLPAPQRVQRMLEAVERFADGEAESDEVDAAQMSTWDLPLKWANSGDPIWLHASAVAALWPALRLGQIIHYGCETAAYESRARAAALSSQRRSFRLWKRGPKLSAEEYSAAHATGAAAEKQAFCHRIRDIVGNPFRPAAFAPEWRTDTEAALAAQMYESRDFAAMPILADALQDAGCDSADILDHCRGPGPHVRGCWVVDLVLGKE